MTKDIETQAREYASDIVPPNRHPSGVGMFYRDDIRRAYHDGANWQKAQTAPLALVPPAAEQREDWKASTKPTEFLGRAIAKQLQDLRDEVTRNNKATAADLADIRSGYINLMAMLTEINKTTVHTYCTLLAHSQPARPSHHIPMRPDIESIPDESGQGSGMGVTPAPSTHLAGIEPAVLERLEHFARGMPKVYAGQPFDCDKDIKADVRAVIKALTPAPETRAAASAPDGIPGEGEV